MATYLDRILEQHRHAAAADRDLIEDLLDVARATPRPRGFRAALAASDELGVIAEVKRRSPSKGDLAPDLDPASVALSYARGGAAALSVLTDEEWFGGSADDLRRAREAVDLPTLRKDFTVDARDVVRARIMGADAVLLIVAALDDNELVDFHSIAGELELDVLVEVHDEAELEQALRVGADLIGVNQRDLVTFEVDTDRAVRVGASMPEGVLRVAESGIRGAADAHRLAESGFHAVLVGESLVTSGDPARERSPISEWLVGSLHRVFVKVCGITSEEDALLAVAMGADAVGFNFVPSSPRFLAVSRAADIAKRLPPEILTVGVFRDEARARVVELANHAGLRAAQLHGHESDADTRWVRERVPVVIKAFPGGDRDLARATAFGADIVLIDSESPGSGQVFDWSLAEGAPSGLRVLLAGGLTPDNVAEAIDRVRPWGVDVASGVESAPGIKDPTLVRRFVSAAKAAEPADYHGREENRPFDWMLDD